HTHADCFDRLLYTDARRSPGIGGRRETRDQRQETTAYSPVSCLASRVSRPRSNAEMPEELPADQNSVADQAWSVRMANSVIRRHSPTAARWHYEDGLVLKAIEQVGRATGEARYRRFVKDTIDLFIDLAGGIRTFNLE